MIKIAIIDCCLINIAFYVFNGQHGASALVNTIQLVNTLAMQILENNNVINSQQVL